jgi:hypothetical protein
MSLPYGLKIEESYGRLAYERAIEPDVSVMVKILQNHLNAPQLDESNISYLDEGSYNKVYTVTIGPTKYVMRVALPIEVPEKTTSEVAMSTMLRTRVSRMIPPYRIARVLEWARLTLV